MFGTGRCEVVKSSMFVAQRQVKRERQMEGCVGSLNRK